MGVLGRHVVGGEFWMWVPVRRVRGSCLKVVVRGGEAKDRREGSSLSGLGSLASVLARSSASAACPSSCYNSGLKIPRIPGPLHHGPYSSSQDARQANKRSKFYQTPLPSMSTSLCSSNGIANLVAIDAPAERRA